MSAGPTNQRSRNPKPDWAPDFGCVVFNGSTLVLQTKSGDSTSPASTKIGGHGSVAESDIASVGARVRFPLTAPGLAAVAQWQSRSLPKSRRPVRFRPAAPEFRDVG